MTDLDPERFTGRWFQHSRDAQAIWNLYYECTTGEYAMNEDGGLDWNFRANFGYPFEWYGDCSGHSIDIG